MLGSIYSSFAAAAILIPLKQPTFLACSSIFLTFFSYCSHLFGWNCQWNNYPLNDSSNIGTYIVQHTSLIKLLLRLITQLARCLDRIWHFYLPIKSFPRTLNRQMCFEVAKGIIARSKLFQIKLPSAIDGCWFCWYIIIGTMFSSTSIYSSSYFVIFLSSFSCPLLSPGTAMSIIQTRSFLIPFFYRVYFQSLTVCCR